MGKAGQLARLFHLIDTSERPTMPLPEITAAVHNAAAKAGRDVEGITLIAVSKL